MLSLKIPKRTFLISNLRILIFARNFFKLSTQNYTNKAILVPKLKPFVSHELPLHKSEGTDSNHKNLFKDFSLKISRKEHFCPKFIDFDLCEELCSLTNSKVLISNMAIIFQI